MLKSERFAKLLAILEENEFATVKELSERLQVSMPTVRRDLTELAAQERILRSHGGATRVDDSRVRTPVDFRRSSNAREKAALARTAARLIRDDSVIILDASTTVANIVDYLEPFRNLIVVTNSLMVAAHLKSQGGRVYCLAGEVISSSLAVGGRLALESAENFNIDLMFFSSYGVNSRGMIVDPEESETELRRSLLQRADRSVFLCDSSKFGKSAAFSLAPLTSPDYVVTGAPLPPGYPDLGDRLILAE